ncbi:MAG TPA: GTP 3',8-cyclase MoaA [Dermatophilaceae bacterium]|nr:GTP 3',8-cyclase MoaA [Dermatophilaceae bacterium]
MPDGGLTPERAVGGPGMGARPADGLIDTFGRRVRDLRVSVTDHCNLRCTYCLPASGLPWLNRAEMLTATEIIRLVRLFVQWGVTNVRLTGGEPLLRPDLADIVTGIARLTPRPRIALTTNGVGLAGAAEKLARAGLDRVNVSLDTTDWENYVQLTRRDRFDDVVVGLAAAAEAGLKSVKVNAVVIRGANDDDVADLLQFCIDNGYELRFIEQMPLDAQHGWRRELMVTAGEVHTRLAERFRLTPTPGYQRGSAPARRFLVDGGPETVGVIASVTEPFCDRCDRLRLTAEGMLRNCLFARGEADLRTPLRGGADDAQLVALLRQETQRKARGHGINEPDFTQPTRPMSAIGG